MYNDHIQIANTQGFTPGVRVSFKTPYCGWITIFNEATLHFKFRGSKITFYERFYDEAQEKVRNIKKTVESCVCETLKRLRRQFFRMNLNLKAQTIFGRVFMRSQNGALQIQAQSKNKFVPLTEESLYRQVIEEAESPSEGVECNPSYAAVNTTAHRNGTYSVMFRFTITRNTYQIKDVTRGCFDQILNIIEQISESEVEAALAECERLKAIDRALLEAEEAQAMADIFV